MSKYDDLTAKLREIFQIDKPELDFGIYRIIGARAGEISDYLDKRLKARVQESLAHAGNANLEQLKKELADAIKRSEALGVPADNVPKVQELRQRIAEQGTGAAEHENSVFSHLLTFFSRYYDKGDFISQRRYKGDTYAIPYAGEEVVLHWANKDQYYTKSGENFANYSFTLGDGRSVHFRLIAADIAKDNRKDTDKERCFVLLEPQTRVLTDDEGDEYEEQLVPVEEQNNELLVRFEYRPMPKGSKQDDLVAKAVQAVLAEAAVAERWQELSRREPTEKKPERTLLEKHLTTYTQRNTADYFIHKDLGRFLRGELDFYIKNEVMHLDDVQHAEKFADIEKNLRMIQCLRAIALDLITFLAQLEDFQKKLWLKKKFVVAAHYCFTLDRVIKDAPELLDEIAANGQQWQQWDQLGMLAEGASRGNDYLKSHPLLMVDTALFEPGFRARLLGAIDNLDESLDGLLIHGDNFQALNLLQERYREQVKCVYIDPPYNTGKDGFIYKDSYQTSSWCSSINAGLCSLLPILTDDSLLFISNDDNENENIKKILWLNGYLVKTNLIWNTDGHTDNQFEIKINHEYVTLAQKTQKADYGKVVDPNTREESNLWKNIAENSITKNGPANPFTEVTLPVGFPVNTQSGTIVKVMPEAGFFSELGTQPYFPRNLIKKYGASFPIKYNSAEYKDYKLCNELRVCAGWANLNKLNKFISNDCVPFKDGDGVIEFYLTENGTIYYRKTKDSVRNIVSVLRNFTTTEKMKYELEDMGVEFSYPKPKDLISYILKIGNSSNYLDFFAGSGTTGHAVINLNRQDHGHRKYILVEQGEYFDTVLKPRIQKVVYSESWQNGKATAPQTGISHAFKVLKIESYEDTLNNLRLNRSEAQQSLLDGLSQDAKDDYLLRYLLDIESQGSILSVDSFRKPFACTLKVAVDSAGASEERTIDLVETFNYLIGLRVKQIDAQHERGVVMVQGTLPTGEKTLVLWRDCEQVGYEELERICDKYAINPRDSEFDVVYINGDHNIPTELRTTEEEGGITKKLTVRQIEPEFLSRMFGGEV